MSDSDNKKLIKALDQMTVVILDRQLNEVRVPLEYFVQDGVVKITSENGQGAVDYYGEFRGGYPWVMPELEALAEKLGGIWEWEHPGCIGFFV